MKDFVFVDIHRADAHGQHYPWRRVNVVAVQDIVDKYLHSGFHLYTTIQRFANPEHQDVELEYCPLAFDFDCADNIESAHQDVITLVDHIAHDVYGVGINPEEMMIYFSGNRGFHVTVNAECFNAQPQFEMIKIYRLLADHINKQLNLKTLDLSVYTKRRAWRIPNTIHVKTGLYKRALTYEQLKGDVESIKELAKEPANWVSIVEVI